jgi:hypothetical protein
MRTALRFFSYYLAVHILITAILTGGFLCIPVIALVVMVLLGTRWRSRRTLMALLAGFNVVIYLVLFVMALIPPREPSAVIVAVIHVPFAVYAGFVLVALKRNAI